jgi:hypothetical protein
MHMLERWIYGWGITLGQRRRQDGSVSANVIAKADFAVFVEVVAVFISAWGAVEVPQQARYRQVYASGGVQYA